MLYSDSGDAIARDADFYKTSLTNCCVCSCVIDFSCSLCYILKITRVIRGRGKRTLWEKRETAFNVALGY